MIFERLFRRYRLRFTSDGYPLCIGCDLPSLGDSLTCMRCGRLLPKKLVGIARDRAKHDHYEYEDREPPEPGWRRII